MTEQAEQLEQPVSLEELDPSTRSVYRFVIGTLGIYEEIWGRFIGRDVVIDSGGRRSYLILVSDPRFDPRVPQLRVLESLIREAYRVPENQTP